MVCIEAHTMNMKVVAPTLPSFINDRKVEPVEVPLDFTIKEEPIEIPLDVIITEEQDSEEISGDVAFSFSINKKVPLPNGEFPCGIESCQYIGNSYNSLRFYSSTSLMNVTKKPGMTARISGRKTRLSTGAPRKPT